MKRGSPMKRTAFVSKGIVARAQREPRDHTLSMQALVDSTLPRRPATYSGTTTGEVVEKENAIQSPAYQKAAKALGYCMYCGARGVPLDFCHQDFGKGLAIKTDSRRGFPACRPCHTLLGSSGKIPRAERRIIELGLGLRTRQAVRAAGTWPKRVPDLGDEN